LKKLNIDYLLSQQAVCICVLYISETSAEECDAKAA